ITWAEFTIIKVDPGKSPATIDLRFDKAIDNRGLQPKLGATIPGIYRLEGDTLKVFVGEDENDRPKAFPEKAKQGRMTLKRVKEHSGKEDKPAQAQIIKPSGNLITGLVDGGDVEKLSPAHGFIIRQEDLDKLRKAWLLEEKVPKVDFKTDLVVVATSREGPI